MEEHAHFSPSVFTVSDGARLDGYFQSPKYFVGVEDQIRDELTRVCSPSSWMLAKEAELASLGKWTAIHVRRGNYASHPSMGFVGIDFYMRAVRLLDEVNGRLPLVLFSDTPEVLGEFVEIWGDRLQVVAPPASTRPIESLTVMSHASALVIGNSTFSWWAAFLRHRYGRTVIAPRPWLNDVQVNERDLFPPDWITLGRE